MAHILAAIDFSPVSDDVVALAERLAVDLAADLTLLHVAAPDPYFVGYEVGPQHVRDNRAHELREEHQKLDALSSDLRKRGIKAKAFLIAGPSVETVIAQARERGVDLIVIGAHRRSRAAKILLGSVGEGVLRHAPCPVTVVPPQD